MPFKINLPVYTIHIHAFLLVLELRPLRLSVSHSANGGNLGDTENAIYMKQRIACPGCSDSRQPASRLHLHPVAKKQFQVQEYLQVFNAVATNAVQWKRAAA